MDSYLQADIPPSAWILIGIGILLLLISGFMSSSEVAFFSLSPQDIEDIKEEEHPNDGILHKLLGDSERLLATILIGNNLVNVTIVMLLSVGLSRVFDFTGNASLQFLVQVVLLTFLLLLFGEIIPKVYAQGKPLEFSRFAAPIVAGISRALYPFSSLLVRSTNIVTRRMHRKRYDFSADELSQAVDLLQDQGEEEKAMFGEIINFHAKTASEIMIPRIDMVSIPSDLSFREMLDRLIESGYSRVPIYEGSQDHIQGIIYLKDLIPYRAEEDDFDWLNLIRKAYFVPENKRLDDLLEEFRSQKIHMSIVVDEFGGTSGLITLEDILEEVVGEISDEYDEEELPYKRLPDGSYLFDGKTSINDFLRAMELPAGTFGEAEEAVDTLGGLVLEVKEELPSEGDRVEIAHWQFIVRSVEKFRITEIQVIPPEGYKA